MPDSVKGTVHTIVDSAKIAITIEYVSKTNRTEYPLNFETGINKLEPPFLKNAADEIQKMDRLKKKLLGETVRCSIIGKGKDGCYSSNVTCEGPRFRGKRKRI